MNTSLRITVTYKLSVKIDLSTCGHTRLNTPVPIRTLKLSNVGLVYYLDGSLPGNHLSCRLFIFLCASVLMLINNEVLDMITVYMFVKYVYY